MSPESPVRVASAGAAGQTQPGPVFPIVFLAEEDQQRRDAIFQRQAERRPRVAVRPIGAVRRWVR